MANDTSGAPVTVGELYRSLQEHKQEDRANFATIHNRMWAILIGVAGACLLILADMALHITERAH